MTNKRRRKRKKTFVWFKNLSITKKILLIFSCVVLLVAFALVVYVSSKFSMLNQEEIEPDEFIFNDFEEEVGVGYTNFVLFGGDSRTGAVDKDLNTDAIIIVSLNNETKEVKMVSVFRDTLLDLSNGNIQKCNAAYSRGGAKQAINMLNMNLDLNIQKYVTVDFGAVVDVIDMLGGIEIDVSEAEMKATNAYIPETARVAGKEAVYLSEPGLQVLNGVQATTYARIRKGVGDDFARTERQRLVIQKAAEKAMKADLLTLNKIIDTVFPQVSTNLTMTEILKYAKDVTKYKIGESAGFPFDRGTGTIPGKGSCVFPVALDSNVQQLHEFLYGTTEYQPSKKVQSISSEIEYLVGNSQSVDTEPDVTTQPEIPVEPETPVEPEPPVEPEAPVEPETPVEPEPPVEPEAPVEPETPVEPEPPTNPGITDPGTTDPGITDPGTTDPGTTDPGTTGPTDPEATTESESGI